MRFPVLRHQRNALLYGLYRCMDGYRLFVHQYVSGCSFGMQAKQRFHQLRSAGAHQSIEANDLAFVQGEGNIGEYIARMAGSAFEMKVLHL